MARWSGCR
jgi:5'-deoxynucleotidase YfbR-like HD superfamily hydrolase